MATVVSLLLALAAGGLWVRGYFAYDAIVVRPSDGHQLTAASSRGLIGLRQLRAMPGGGWTLTFDSGPGVHSGPPESVGDHMALGPLGFLVAEPSPHPVLFRACVAPAWFVLVLAAALPTVRGYRRYRRGPRRPPGHCAACGYDCRATPDRPECGAASTTA